MAKKKKGGNKMLLILLLIVGVLVIVIVVGSASGGFGRDRSIQVEGAKVELSSITESVSASGQIQPEIEVQVSPDVSGEIIQLDIEEGDSVVKGQFLLKIRPDNLEAILERDQAALSQAKANLANSRAALTRAKAQQLLAQQAFKRNKELYDQEAISLADYEQAETNLKVAKQDVESAMASVEASRFNVQSAQASVNRSAQDLSLTTVYAPNSGTVSKLSVEQGERVVGTATMAGTEMLRIADLNNMEVRVNVNENDIIRVSKGDTAIIDVDSYNYLDKQFKGVVTQIANTANDRATQEAVTEFEVRIKILNSSFADLPSVQAGEYAFRPGMTAAVEIVTDKKYDVVTVPISAVTTRTKNVVDRALKGKPAMATDGAEGNGDEDDKAKADAKKEGQEEVEVVFVVENGKVKLVPIKTGISDYESIEITEGLKTGQTVVSGPFLAVSKRLKNGDAVQGKGIKTVTAKKPEPKEAEPAQAEEAN